MNFPFSCLAGKQETDINDLPIPRKSTDLLPRRLQGCYPVFVLNEFQQRFANYLEVGDIVVKAPTGSGKTYLQDLLYFNALPGSTLVVLPTKSLLFERYQKTSFAQCHVLHGDSNTRMDEFTHTLVYSTAEKAAELLTRRIASKFLSSLSLIIIDEFQFILTSYKTYSVICFAARTYGIRICGFSAFFPTPLASNLGFKLLEYKPTTAGSFEFIQLTDKNLLDLSKLHLNVAIRHIIYIIPKLRVTLSKRREILEKQSVLIFCPTKRIAELVAEEFYLNAEPLNQQAHIFRKDSLNRYSSRAIGFHHSGLDISDRKDIENMFRNKQIRILASTSTLSVGVNVNPALVVIFTSMVFGEDAKRLDYAQLMQMAGRSGRCQGEIAHCLVADDTQTCRWSSLVSRNRYFSEENQVHFGYDLGDFAVNILYILYYYYDKQPVPRARAFVELQKTLYFESYSAAYLEAFLEEIRSASGLLHFQGGGIGVNPLAERLFYYHVGYADFVSVRREIAENYHAAIAAAGSRTLRCLLYFERGFGRACAILRACSERKSGVGADGQKIAVETEGGMRVLASRPGASYQIVLLCSNGGVLTGAFRPADYYKRRASLRVDQQYVDEASVQRLYIQNLNCYDDFVLHTGRLNCREVACQADLPPAAAACE